MAHTNTDTNKQKIAKKQYNKTTHPTIHLFSKCMKMYKNA